MLLKFLLVFVCTVVYTVARYIVFGPVSAIHMPVYLFNKAVSMAAVVCLFFVSHSYLKSREEGVRFWGRAFLHSVFMHVLLSLAILSREYYPKFFGLEKMNLCGELSVLFGVCATYPYLLIQYKCVAQKQMHLSQVLIAVFVAVHLFVMGINGWITIDKWHGHLPPISLISFVLALLACLFFLWPTRKSSLKGEKLD